MRLSKSSRRGSVGVSSRGAGKETPESECNSSTGEGKYSGRLRGGSSQGVRHGERSKQLPRCSMTCCIMFESWRSLRRTVPSEAPRVAQEMHEFGYRLDAAAQQFEHSRDHACWSVAEFYLWALKPHPYFGFFADRR